MGIRFYCPNGHKMNVKEFQAGKQGKCPVCGISMQIPLTSTRPSSRQKGDQATPAGPIDLSETLETPVTNHGPGATTSPPSLTSGGAPPAAQPATTDPLAEGGEAVWFVRPPSGGQYGPATAAIMRTWLAEGRVAADALVWREGWPEWQEAATVFRELSTTPAIASQAKTSPAPIIVKPTSEPIRTHPPAYRSPQRNTQVIIVAGLIVAVVVLLIIFFVVL